MASCLSYILKQTVTMKTTGQSYSPITLPLFLIISLIGLSTFVIYGIDHFDGVKFLIILALIIIVSGLGAYLLSNLCSWKVRETVVIITNRRFKNLVMPRSKVQSKKIFEFGPICLSTLILNFDGENLRLFSFFKG